MSQLLIVIPARLASVRLPNKPLVLINGKPMIVHVWERAVASGLGEVVVACCGPEIANVITDAGGKAYITDPNLPSGSDRIKAVLDDMPHVKDDAIILNLQGDLPTISKDALSAALEPLKDPKVDIGTIATLIKDSEQIHNPNVVKVAMTLVGEGVARALYFSRAPIPYGAAEYYHHIGLYAYRRSALERFLSLPASPLEKIEKLEQLRVLEAGMRIDVRLVAETPHTVDTPQDLKEVIEYLQG
jgi:3-deoxy-manno-octulosonate cytidylyltransferase (CMP-KDO synthetase)